MILYKDLAHPWSSLQAGTLSSHYKECTALSSLLHFSQFIAMDISSAAEWIMDPEAFLQLYDMFNDKSIEIDEFLFLPYLSDLGLCMRLPYASSHRPALHNWTHTLGCMLVASVPKEQRYLEPRASSLVSAVLAALALSKSAKIRKQVDKDREQQPDFSIMDDQGSAIQISDYQPLYTSING